MVSFKVFNRKYRDFRENIDIKQEHSIFRILFWNFLSAKSNIYLFQNFKTVILVSNSNFFKEECQECSEIFGPKIKIHIIYEFFADNFRYF